MERKFKVSKNQSFLICLLFIMIIYMPVNYLSFVNIDDAQLIKRLHDNFQNISFFDLFLVNHTNKYYRPLLEIIYYIDYTLWGVSIKGYHFGNYLIHMLNACLVFFIALQLFEPGKKSHLYAAVSMLFFALNPLTCESVAWVSGRSDLAGTFFSLLAVYFYFLKNKFRYVLTPISIFLGLLCKENALAVIPILVLLECLLNHTRKKRLKENIKGCFIWSVLVVIPLFLYLFLRTNGWEHYTYTYIEAITPSAGKTSIDGKIDVAGVLTLFPVIAFYLKKLIIPFPLNFAISQINTLFYALLFVAGLGVNIFWCIKKKIIYLFFTSVLILSFLPALPVALGGVAWVPLAERYLYFSVSVMGLILSFLIQRFYKKGGIANTPLIVIVCIYILMLSASTVNREFVWKNGKTLWADTLEKNPDSSMVLFKYGQSIGGKKGQWAYHKAIENATHFKWKAMTLMAIARYEGSIGNTDTALLNIKKALNVEKTYDNYCEAAEIVLKLGRQDSLREQAFITQAIEFYRAADSKKKTAYVLYKTGILLKRINKMDQANELFTIIIRRYPGSPYALYAKTHLSRKINF